MPNTPGPARRAALSLFRVMPRRVRVGIVHAVAPSYSVGAVAVIRHEDTVLFLGQSHRRGWSLPGGLLDRGENATAAVMREVLEETGLRIEVGVPSVANVNPRARHLDVVFEVFCDERPTVRPGSEAHRHAWIVPGELETGDKATKQIMALVERAGRPGGRHGRLIAQADEELSDDRHGDEPGDAPVRAEDP